jgi:hypothetical protein
MGFIIFKILRSEPCCCKSDKRQRYVGVCLYVIERSLNCFCEYDPEVLYESSKGKGKTIPVEVWRGSKCSRRLRLQNFMAVGT